MILPYFNLGETKIIANKISNGKYVKKNCINYEKYMLKYKIL